MRTTIKTWLMASALMLTLAGVALAQGMKPEMWNGTHWKEFSQDVKVAYIKGIGNMADFEVAVGGKERAGCVAPAFVQDLKGKTIEDIVKEVDKYYKEHPDKSNTPVVEVVLRQCTSLCKPGAQAAPKKK
jgi:hypothetical protein